MDAVISISNQGRFRLVEARQIAIIIKRFTEGTAARVDFLIGQLEGIEPTLVEKTQPIEAEINSLITQWNEKVKKLGGHPKGMWRVDFPFVAGYYCWKYPEADIGYWRKADEDFAARALEGLRFEKNFEKQTETSSRARANKFPSR